MFNEIDVLIAVLVLVLVAQATILLYVARIESVLHATQERVISIEFNLKMAQLLSKTPTKQPPLRLKPSEKEVSRWNGSECFL